MTSTRLLIVDDEPSMLRYLRTILDVDSYQVETASSGRQAVERLQRDPVPDLVLLDVLMPEIDGIETLERIRSYRPGLKVVMLSCVSEPRKIVQAIRLGACDYLTKPFQRAELDSVLQHVLRPGLEAVEKGAGTVEELDEDRYFIAAGPAIQLVRAQANRMAAVDVPVLILGESGSGKEVIARLIHKLSPRARGSFLKVNCAALPGELLESELFGYEPGAFTGATRSKPGKFELCNRGTILLDEIAEMPPALQAKLLHVLQDQQFSRLGGRSNITVDVRVLAATNVNIKQALADQSFRPDLYYRLNAFTLTLPPLRQRQEEIPLLLRHFMARFAARYARAPLPFSPRMMEACLRYPWPGNLRELENFVKRYLILNDEELVLGELAPRTVFAAPSEQNLAAEQGPLGLRSMVRDLTNEAEAEAISRALDETQWSRKRAARLLKISYKALLYKMRQYGIGEKTVARS
ncbi:MAG TPA: sigma-54 dependent transcriptional regulator [Terriglobia bacterium]|nr:sigma-54 dependent transcriptional regulator [Terriglobia bacterium]